MARLNRRLEAETLNARQVGTGSRPAARTNKRWSYQASGPVWIPGVYDGRDQTFFHFMYQPQKRRSGRVFRDYAMPTARMRAGDLNEYFAVSKCATEATIPCPVNPYTGQPFPNNVIPDGMINPIARNIMNNTGLLPLPNTGGAGPAVRQLQFHRLQRVREPVVEFQIRPQYHRFQHHLLHPLSFQLPGQQRSRRQPPAQLDFYRRCRHPGHGHRQQPHLFAYSD